MSLISILYQVNDSVLLRLKHPFGKLLTGPPEKTLVKLGQMIEDEKPRKICSVGDVVSSNIMKNGIRVELIIIDFKSRRQSVETSIFKEFNVLKVKNPAGSISFEAYELISKVVQRSSPIIIIVDGEEDLLTLPVIKFAPIGSFVIYGQPQVGIVIVTVTDIIKQETELLLNTMKKIDKS